MATNRRRSNGRYLSAVVDHPAAPVSGDPVRAGELTGVATINEGVSITGETTYDTAGVYDLSVKAIDGAGNSAVAYGDKIFYTDADTPVLNKKATGRPFGYALEAITSGSTDTIKVKVERF